MTTKADFSTEEWQLILEAPPSAGMIVVTAQRGGTFRETIAMAKAYVEARQQHATQSQMSPIIFRILLQPAPHQRLFQFEPPIPWPPRQHLQPKMAHLIGRLIAAAHSLRRIVRIHRIRRGIVIVVAH